MKDERATRRRRGGRRFVSRGRRWRWQLAALAVVSALWCSAPGAWGLSQRGHVFGSAFGEPGEGSGQFRFGGGPKLAEPAGVAVNEATGDVYVVDGGNHRIEVFGPTGGFIAAWGWGVSDGEARYEVCTHACRPGLAGTGKGEFKEPGAVAVDNSPGGSHEVYVDVNTAAKRPAVERFPADGEKPLGRLPVEEEGRLDGIAVDSHGTVWLYRGEEEEEGDVEGFSDGEKPVELTSFPVPVVCPKPGFAVDAAGSVFYADHELLDSGDECPAVVEREQAEAEKHGKEEGKDARPVLTAKLAEGGLSVATAGVDRQNTTGVAVDEASSSATPLGAAANGDVYLDNGTSVAAFTADGSLIQRFGSAHLQGGEGVAIDAATGELYVVDAAAQAVDVFEAEPAGEPVAEGLEARHISSSEAELTARIDPNGTATHFYFQYGTVNCANASGCLNAPEPPGVEVAAGYGEQPVSVKVSGLAPSTTYHFRIVVEGGAEGGEEFATLTTLPASQGLLADGRAWEMVSPPEKDGSGIEPLAKEGGLVQAAADGSAVTYVANGPIVAEPEGNRAPEATQVLSSRRSTGWSSQDLSTPHEKGEGIESGEPSEFRFFSSDLAVAVLEPPGGKTEPAEAPPLAPGAGEKTVYLRDDPPLEPEASERAAYEAAEANSGFLSPGYAPLVTPLQDTAKTNFGGQLEFLDATPDARHVVLESGAVALLEGSAPGLYESEPGGGLQLVSVLPDGAPAGAPSLGDTPELGGANANARNALSSDGSKVFFYSEGLEEGSESAEYRRLYMRDTTAGVTIQLNAAQGVAEPAGEEEEDEVAFQGASSDGSRVFFTDTAPLTPESGQRPGPGSERDPGDLYECQIVEEAGKPRCELKDITALAGGSAEVLNLASGISEDGSYVYFVANGALTPDAEQGDCAHEKEEPAPPGAACNLYQWHEGKITLIARLSNEDSGDWGSLQAPVGSKQYLQPRPDLADLTARVSPDGRYLAFMSQMPLTGYDNLDSAHIAEGVRDQEVYLYDSATRLLTCASCNSRGPSVGVYDTERSGEGQGLLVDRREDWKGQYLGGSVPGWAPLGIASGALHQPRYLSDNGRLFFNSPDALVPQATNGKEDVYEYEPGGVGTCGEPNGCVSLISSGASGQESAFMEASEEGESAFFITAQALVPADHDTDFDLYDARVCSAASPCLTSEDSSAQACQTSRSCNPTTTMSPSVGLPATLTAQGTGEASAHQVLGSTASKPPDKPRPLTRAQRLARALKTCRKDRNHKKRAVCERQARRRYGPKQKGKKPAPQTGKGRR